jgi:uncharacterized protein YegP (UPF0339 family)
VNDEPYIKEVQLYIDSRGEYRFTAIARNGEPIVVSSEGYRDERDVEDAIVGVFGKDVVVRQLEQKEL